jgi:VanZ family protein
VSESINGVLKKEMQLQNRRLFWRWLLVLVYAGSVFVVSAIPGNSLPHVRVSDKLLHTVEFGGLTVLLCRALVMQMPGRSRRSILFLSLVATMCYGVLDEVHQLFVPQRMSDVADFVADSFGALLGGRCWLWVSTRWPWLQ